MVHIKTRKSKVTLNKTPYYILDRTSYQVHVYSSYTKDDNNSPHKTYLTNPEQPSTISSDK